MDRAGHSITLANGDTYNVPLVDEMKTIKVGEKVQIMYGDGDALSISHS